MLQTPRGLNDHPSDFFFLQALGPLRSSSHTLYGFPAGPVGLFHLLWPYGRGLLFVSVRPFGWIEVTCGAFSSVGMEQKLLLL
ncbi:hypothetical protein ACQJBY_064968 [Aegilops geniculata]